MKKKDILITGGAGYIGSHTIFELYSSAFRLIVFDNISNPTLKKVRGAEQIICEKITFSNSH